MSWSLQAYILLKVSVGDGTSHGAELTTRRPILRGMDVGMPHLAHADIVQTSLSQKRSTLQQTCATSMSLRWLAENYDAGLTLYATAPPKILWLGSNLCT